MDRRKFFKSLAGLAGTGLVSRKLNIPIPKKDAFESPCVDCPKFDHKNKTFSDECELCSFHLDKTVKLDDDGWVHLKMGKGDEQA